jgi:hypothetical protein
MAEAELEPLPPRLCACNTEESNTNIGKKKEKRRKQNEKRKSRGVKCSAGYLPDR